MKFRNLLLTIGLMMSSMSVSARSHYNLVGISANQLHFTAKDSYDDEDSGSMFGFGVHYLHGFPLMQNQPLYLETGGSMKFMFYTDHLTASTLLPDGSYELEEEFRQRIQMVTLSVPVNVAYKYDINDRWSITPFIGIDVKAHLSGWVTDITIDSNGEFRDVGNLFDRKDMDDLEWHRFQLGWNVGLRAAYRHFSVAGSFGTDFVRLSNHYDNTMSNQNIAVTFGYSF